MLKRRERERELMKVSTIECLDDGMLAELFASARTGRAWICIGCAHVERADCAAGAGVSTRAVRGAACARLAFRQLLGYRCEYVHDVGRRLRRRLHE